LAGALAAGAAFLVGAAFAAGAAFLAGVAEAFLVGTGVAFFVVDAAVVVGVVSAFDAAFTRPLISLAAFFTAAAGAAFFGVAGLDVAMVSSSDCSPECEVPP